MKEDRCCGNCCWFAFEDTLGYGTCVREYPDYMTNCSDDCLTGNCVSRQEMRHHKAVLLQANRYRRDQHVPSIYRMPDPAELGKAIDFAVKFIEVFSAL